MSKVWTDLEKLRRERQKSLNDFIDVDYEELEVTALASSMLPSSEAKFISTGRSCKSIPMYTFTRDGRAVEIEVEVDLP